MMGVLFLPPQPILSQDQIAAFDAVASQFQNVPVTPAFPDSTTQENKGWLPTPPVAPPPSDPAKPWEDVQKFWATPTLGVGAGAQAVAGWAKAMGWDADAVSGAVPTGLVGQLQQMYVAAPLVAQTA
jgi:hypothetical protein